MEKLKSNKFKTKTVNIFFCDTLNNESASYNSLLTFVLKRGTVNYPALKELTIREQELFNTKVYSDVDKKGEIQVASFTLSVIDEKYVKEQEDIFERAVDFLFEIIKNPLVIEDGFDREYVEQEKNNLCDLIESKINDKSFYANFRCFEEMCAGEPYAFDELGEPEIIRDITEKSLYKYYKDVFLKLPAKIFLTGDLTDENIEYVKNTFKEFEEFGDIFQINPGKLVEAPENVKNINEKMNVLQGKLCMGFRTMTNALSDDYYDLTICNIIFGGGLESKLFKNVREKESLAYYAYSRLDKFKGLMIAAAGIDAENKYKTEKLILKQLEDIKNGDISDDEFNAAVNSYIDAVNKMQDGQRTLSEFYLGQMLFGMNDSLEDIKSKIKKVTKESVAKSAEKIKLDTVYFLSGS